MMDNMMDNITVHRLAVPLAELHRLSHGGLGGATACNGDTDGIINACRRVARCTTREKTA